MVFATTTNLSGWTGYGWKQWDFAAGVSATTYKEPNAFFTTIQMGRLERQSCRNLHVRAGRPAGVGADRFRRDVARGRRNARLPAPAPMRAPKIGRAHV